MATRLNGIDVSAIQGVINWPQVKSAGYVFAFNKATEGTGLKISTFDSNMINARSAGIYIGAYHFARPELGNSASAEANYFYNVIKPYIQSGYLRPVLDVEGNAHTIGWTALSNWIIQFMERFYQLSGVYPFIYTGWYRFNLAQSVTKYNLWVAQYSTEEPDPGIWPAWDFWQYSETGRVSGIIGNVDLNYFEGGLTYLINKFSIQPSIQQNQDLTVPPKSNGEVPLYRFRNVRTGIHFFTANLDEKSLLFTSNDWEFESIASYVYDKPIKNAEPVHRFYNTLEGYHFFTTDENIRSQNIQLNTSGNWIWVYEGIAFYAYSSELAGTQEMFMMFNTRTGAYFYTIDEKEKDAVTRQPSTWIWEPESSFFVFPINTESPSGLSPVFRLFYTGVTNHLFTSSLDETIVQIKTNPNVTFEGTPFYVFNSEVSNSVPIYRFRNPVNNAKAFSTSNQLNDKPWWEREGIAFYARSSQVGNAIPIYEYYNASSDAYFYTENSSLNVAGWTRTDFVSPIFYAYKTDSL